MSVRILIGDCRDTLRELPDGCVQTCVTSPPYFGLRDYGHDGQIGLEPTPDEFVAALVGVFREVRRVLRDDGTVWLNLGDSYASSGIAGPLGSPTFTRHGGNGINPKADGYAFGRAPTPSDCKPKDLLGVPWMVAFALRADGWYLRSDIIWAKPNPMPESVTDRPTKAHEYLFLLSKSARYFYDADAVREGSDHPHLAGKLQKVSYHDDSAMRQDGDRVVERTSDRNKRSVWTVATQPYPGAHFATFPAKLIEPCILAGSSPKACGVCGAPWQRVVERTAMGVKPTPKREAWQAEDDHARTQTSRTVGWEPFCGHQDDTGQSVVLDPFAGSGTTGAVAVEHGRAFIGCELNPAYGELIRDRLLSAPLALEGFGAA